MSLMRSALLSAMIVSVLLLGAILLFGAFAHGDDDPLVQRHKILDERIRAVNEKLEALKRGR